MIKGTNQSYIFRTPFLGSEIFAVKVTFWQPGNYGTSEQPLPIVKTQNNCILVSDSYDFEVRLSPSETNRFLTNRKAYMQAVVTSTSGEIAANTEHPITVYPLFDGGNTSTPGASDIVILDGQII